MYHLFETQHIFPEKPHYKWRLGSQIDLSQPQIFNNNIYGTEYMLGTVLEAEDTAVNKTKIPGLVELTFSW